MNLAWFRPHRAPARAGHDDTALLIGALGRRHRIQVIGRDDAHTFVWRQQRGDFDLALYELDDSPAYAFIWPYLLRYPGLLLLRSSSLGTSRRALLSSAPGHLRREIAFNGAFSMVRVPLAVSRLTVVYHPALAETLAAQYPGVRVRSVTPGVARPDVPAPPDAAIFGVIGADRRTAALIRRAVARAEALGSHIDVRWETEPGTVLPSSSVVIALEWPPRGRAATAAIAAAAAGRVPIVMDTSETADWPFLNPQTWQPWHAFDSRAAAGVSLYAPDEEHSLLIALRRLHTDHALRQALGTGGPEWWRSTFTIEHALNEFDACLHDAASLPAPPLPADWPRHLDVDAGEPARAILAAFGLSIDLLQDDVRQ